jgi:hypothetical protein
MYLAMTDLSRARWTDAIHEEAPSRIRRIGSGHKGFVDLEKRALAYLLPFERYEHAGPAARVQGGQFSELQKFRH